MAAPALSLFSYIKFKTHLIIIKSLLQLIASLGCYSRFSRVVTAAILVHRTIAKTVFREFYSTIMQNLSDILPLFSTPTWLSRHESENQE